MKVKTFISFFSREIQGIIKEIIKTAIENNQNLVVEGSYNPSDWKVDFDNEYLKEIKYYCFVMIR